MKVIVASVGKLKERAYRELCDDYGSRIDRFARFTSVELRDEGESEVAQQFHRATPDRARTVALEVTGDAWSSERLARFVGDCENASVPAVVFCIGGAYGLPKSTSMGADLRLSLSAMTLPHRLARVVLLEQIYRAYTILRNQPYSH